MTIWVYEIKFLRAQFSSTTHLCSTLFFFDPMDCMQHTRLPCPSATGGACSNSCLSSRWCHPTISSSAIPFSRLEFLPESGSFPVNQLFASGGQSVGASASVLLMNIQDWFPLGLNLWYLQSKGLSRVFSNTTVQKHRFLSAQLSL